MFYSNIHGSLGNFELGTIMNGAATNTFVLWFGSYIDISGGHIPRSRIIGS